MHPPRKEDHNNETVDIIRADSSGNYASFPVFDQPPTNNYQRQMNKIYQSQLSSDLRAQEQNRLLLQEHEKCYLSFNEEGSIRKRDSNVQNINSPSKV